MKGWKLPAFSAVVSVVRGDGGLMMELLVILTTYLHAGSGGGGGGSVVGFSAWRFLYRGWGGLDAGDEEDWRAGAAWPAPASEKRGVRPRLRTTTAIRYRFHLKPLCEGSFFGLGSVLAPSCVDGLQRLYSLYPLWRYLYLHVFTDVFLTV